MTTIEQECSRHNQSTSQKLNDSQGATIEFDDPLSNSYGIENPPVFLAPTPAGGLYIVYRKNRYFLEREQLRLLLVFNWTVQASCGEMLTVHPCCSRHPVGTGIVLQIGDAGFVIPRNRFERVARAQVPGLIVKSAGAANV